jgi:hypothetical protein
MRGIATLGERILSREFEVFSRLRAVLNSDRKSYAAAFALARQLDELRATMAVLKMVLDRRRKPVYTGSV